MELGGEYGIHPDYLLPKLTARQLAEWQAYFKMQPFGQDFHMLMLAKLLAAYMNRHRKEGTEAVEAKDLMPAFRKEQSTEEIKHNLRGALAAFGNR